MPSGPTGESTYLRGITYPTAIAWAPDRRLFIAERSGTIAVADGTTVSVFTTVPTVTTQPDGSYSERGLLGLALSPTFGRDHFVYALYSTTDHAHTLVERWTDCGGRATDPATLIEFPSGPDCCHKGGRLAFGPDGKLYVTLGDEHSVPTPPGGPNPPVPQRTADPRGKILRYDPDGTVPQDNPFGPTNPVWVAGLRNPFGIAFGDGRVFVTSNGPTGDAGSPSTGYDLALFVSAGYIGQWPYCYGYSHLILPYRSCRGRPEPAWSSERGSAPVLTGAAWIDGRAPSAFADHFVFCSDDAGMFVLTPGSPHATVMAGSPNCKLDVAEGPDYALYYSDATTIYRLG
jgi:glucose/arabinose dehydrogenase